MKTHARLGRDAIAQAELDEVNQDVGVELLREAGLVADIADNGKQAVQMAKDGLDVGLGVKYGLGKAGLYVGRLHRYAAVHCASLTKLRRLAAEDKHHAAMHVGHALKGAVGFLGATTLHPILEIWLHCGLWWSCARHAAS